LGKASSMRQSYLGIDIGGTKCAVSLATPEAQILDKLVFNTEESKGPEQAIVKLIASAHELLKKHPHELLAVGISCGSPLDPEQGIILSPPNLSSWQNVQIVKIFSDEFRVPTFLENDANAGALAEFAFGAGRGFQNIVFITFGTGFGAGLILNGKLYRGTNCYAGEIGHIRLAKSGPVGYHKAGSLEGFCSGQGLIQLADSLRVKYPNSILAQSPSAAEMRLAAEAGDELALEAFSISGEYLGRGLAILLDILNPELVIIGSIFVRCEQFIRPAMEQMLNLEALSFAREVCKVVPAGLGDAVGDYAAFSVAHCALHT
jgi:glucokinase